MKAGFVSLLDKIMIHLVFAQEFQTYNFIQIASGGTDISHDTMGDRTVPFRGRS